MKEFVASDHPQLLAHDRKRIFQRREWLRFVLPVGVCRSAGGRKSGRFPLKINGLITLTSEVFGRGEVSLLAGEWELQELRKLPVRRRVVF